MNPLPPQKPSEDEAAAKMMTDTYTGLGIPPNTSMWTLPRKPLPTGKSGGKGASHAPKGHAQGKSKGHKSSKPRKQSFPKLDYGFD